MGDATAVDTALKVVNLVNDVCALVKSNVVETMPRFASALPPGAEPQRCGPLDRMVAEPAELGPVSEVWLDR